MTYFMKIGANIPNIKAKRAIILKIFTKNFCPWLNMEYGG